jgi:hypothetical protein
MSEVAIRHVRNAIKEALLIQRVDADGLTSFQGVTPPIDWSKLAVAAIRALREPTGDMVIAGAEMYVGLDAPEVREIWTKMCEEALR